MLFCGGCTWYPVSQVLGLDEGYAKSTHTHTRAPNPDVPRWVYMTCATAYHQMGLTF